MQVDEGVNTALLAKWEEDAEKLADNPSFIPDREEERLYYVCMSRAKYVLRGADLL